MNAAATPAPALGTDVDAGTPLSASHLLAQTTELIMKAHAARRALFDNADGWDIVWDEIGDRKFTARQLQWGGSPRKSEATRAAQ